MSYLCTRLLCLKIKPFKIVEDKKERGLFWEDVLLINSIDNDIYAMMHTVFSEVQIQAKI